MSAVLVWVCERIIGPRGVGRELLSVAVQKAFAGALERIELEVFASNRSAVRLYETFGFECEGRKVAGRKLDGVTDDILLHAKRKPTKPEAG